MRWPRALEAAVALIAAAVIVRFVPIGIWRRLSGSKAPTVAGTVPDVRIALVRAAVDHAERRLGRSFKCLPRAMAMTAMLRRRGIASSLIIGVSERAEGADPRRLHAWVETNGEVAIGGGGRERFVRLLVLD